VFIFVTMSVVVFTLSSIKLIDWLIDWLHDTTWMLSEKQLCSAENIASIRCRPTVLRYSFFGQILCSVWIPQTMRWMSTLCRSTYLTLTFCLLCSVASYRHSSATLSDAVRIQLNALQCEYSAMQTLSITLTIYCVRWEKEERHQMVGKGQIS